MNNHRQRVWLIFAMWAIVTIGLIVLVALGQTEGTFFGVLAGNEAMTFLALMDALMVERRRRDPGRRAIADDVPSKVSEVSA